MFPALIAGISGIAGGLLNKPKTTQQNSNSTTNSSNDTNTNFNQQTNPVYDPLQLQMRNFLISQYQNRLNPSGIQHTVNDYIGQGVNNINSTANTNQQALSNTLAARGLSYSGAAGTALAGQESKRIGDITGLRNQESLLKDQLQQQRLTDFSTYMSSLPVGSQSSGTGYQQNLGTSHTNSVGTNYDPGNVLGGAVSGLGGSLAYLYGQGAFGNKTKTAGGNV